MAGLFDGAAGDLITDLSGEELTFKKAIEAFEAIYMASRNLAAKTRVEYKTDIEQLAEFLQARSIAKPEEVGLSYLQSFLAELDARGLTGITRRRKTASIKAFFGFLARSGLVAHNPTRELVPPEREYKEPRYLSTQEYRALLRACAHETRDAAIIELILQTGIRLSEVARLSTYDIELPPRINQDADNVGGIYSRGKGRKERTLPSTTRHAAH